MLKISVTDSIELKEPTFTMEIRRMSSLDRLMGSLSHLDAMDQNELHHSIHTVCSWWRKHLAVVEIKKSLMERVDDLEISLTIMSRIKVESHNFLEGRQLLNDPFFGTHFNKFLTALPRDVTVTFCHNLPSNILISLP